MRSCGHFYSLALSVVGCTAADTASQQVQVAADNFEVVRELTVFDNCTGQILFVASGRMSVSVDPNKERLLGTSHINGAVSVLELYAMRGEEGHE